MNQAPSPLFRKFMIVIATIVCMIYLAYRVLWTFNMSTPYAVFASVFLYVGEVFGILNLLLFFLQVWDVAEPPPQQVLEGRTVDVLVPTFNEDVTLLRATLEACVRMDYPHKTYVLDDGKRPEVEALARELGVIYVTRPNNLHAKAGNLNNALEQTDGEFVVVLDADHVPEPHFITRLIGYFRDEQLAFVQTPHAFYNFDSFQARLDHKNRKYWEEGDLFYRVIQPGRNHWNAPIFAGSAAMFRRTALREVGYIATETVTEDMHTGLRLHARGWRSMAISERLIAGQAPPDITTFHSQRLRWAEGNLGIMKYDNPLFARGLSLAQRLCYFGSMIHWASGLFKLAIYLTPILMLFSGVPPVREFTWELAIITLTYLVVSLYAMKAVSNGYGSIINSELFSMVNFWTQIKGTFRAIFFRRKEFGVTVKGRAAVKAARTKSVWPYVRPQTYLIILSVLALFWGWFKLKLELNPVKALANGLVSAREPWLAEQIKGSFFDRSLLVGFGISDDYFKPVVPTIWVLIFFWLAYKVTQRAFWPADRRLTTRHTVHLPVEYEVVTAQGTTLQYGVTVDLNDTGMALIAYQELPRGSVIRFTIRGAGEVVKCKGEVRSSESIIRSGAADGYRYGIQFQSLTSPQVDAINRICLHYAVPRMYNEYSRGNRNTMWSRIKNWQGRGFAQRRNAPRSDFHMPIIVNSGATEETTQYSSTEDISRIATAAIFDNEIPIGTHVGFLMPTPLGEIRGTAEVVRCDPQELAGKQYHRTVLEFRDFEGQGRTTLNSVVNASEKGQLGSVLKPDKRTVLPNMRVPIMVALMITIPLVILLMTVVFPYYNQDDYTLRRMHDGHGAVGELNTSEIEQFDKVHADTMARKYPSNDRLVNEMTVLIHNYPKTGEHNVRRLKMIDEVAIHLAPRAPDQIDLQQTLLYAYHHTEQWDKADATFGNIEELHKKGRISERAWSESRLEAARISVSAIGKEMAKDPRDRSKEFLDKHQKRASEQYDQLLNEQPGYLPLHNEYAGTLVAWNEFDKAERVYQKINLDRVDLDNYGSEAYTARKLLFDINLKKLSQVPESGDTGIFGNALAERRTARDTAYSAAQVQLAAIKKEKRLTPAMTEAQRTDLTDRMEVNMEATRNKFENTLDILKRIQTRHPDDTEVATQIAQMLLGQKQFDEALRTSFILLERGRYTPETIRVYLDAASAVKRPSLIKKGELSEDSPLNIDDARYASIIHDQHRDKIRNNAVTMTRLGWVLIRANEKEKAQSAIEGAYDALATTPGNTKELRREVAGIFIRLDKWDRAQDVLAGVDDYELHKLRNDIYLREGKFREALSDAEKMRAGYNEKHGAEIEERIATILIADKQFDEALRRLRDLERNKKDNAEVKLRIAQIHVYRCKAPGEPGYNPKDYDVALGMLEPLLNTPENRRANAPRLWRDYVDAAANATTITEPQAKIAEAIAEESLTAHTLKPDELTASYSRLAWVLLKVERKEQADKMLQKAIDMMPTDPKVRKELSGVMARANRNREAAALISDQVTTDEERLALADLYNGARLWEESLKVVDKVMSGTPKPQDFRKAERMHADILSWKGDHDAALKEFAAMRAKYADDTEVAARYAEVLLWQGSHKPESYDKALAEFLALYEKSPNDPKVWNGVAMAVNSKHWSDPTYKETPTLRGIVTQIGDRLLAGNIQDVQLLSRAGLAVSRIDMAKGTQLADRALKLNPQDVNTRIELASTLAEVKRYNDAVKLYEGIILKPENRLTLVWIAVQAERMDLAAEQARLMVKDTENHKGDKAKMLEARGAKRTLAQVLSYKGDYAEAIAMYQDLLDINYESADMKQAIAESHIWWRKYPEALNLFSKLVDENSSYDQLRIMVGFINAASSSPQMTEPQFRQMLKIYDALKDSLAKPELLSRVAWVMNRQQEVAKGDPLLRRALGIMDKEKTTSIVTKEVAGVLVARLFPNQNLKEEPNITIMTRREIVTEGLKLYRRLDPNTEFDSKTKIEYITLLLTSVDIRGIADSEKAGNKAEAEKWLATMLPNPPREDYNIRVRFGEVLLYSARHLTDSTTRYRKGQGEFKLLVDDITDPKNAWRDLGRVRLAQSYLWPETNDYPRAMPILRDLFNVIMTQKDKETLLRDTWMGYLLGISKNIGDRFKVAKSDADVDRIRTTLFAAEDRQWILYCYEKSRGMAPSLVLKKADPDLYAEELGYYTDTLVRLATALAYLGETTKSREVLDNAVSLNTDRRKIYQIWRAHADTMRNMRQYNEADTIYQRLLTDPRFRDINNNFAPSTVLPLPLR